MLSVKQIVLIAMYAEGIREKSYVPEDGEVRIGRYSLTRTEATLQAAKRLGWFDQMNAAEKSIAILLVCDCWNEVQDWFTDYFMYKYKGKPVTEGIDEDHLEAFILNEAKSLGEEVPGRLPDSSNVYHKDMLDPEHRWGSTNKPWVFEGDGSEEFATEDGACAAQRAFRRKNNFNPYNGLPTQA